jgi:ISXO2-like transposase domain
MAMEILHRRRPAQERRSSAPGARTQRPAPNHEDASLAVGQRPAKPEVGSSTIFPKSEGRRVLSENVEVTAHLMSDEWKSFVSIGEAFAAHDMVRHSEREYARGFVHANSAESFNDCLRRTIADVFHHISPEHADLSSTKSTSAGRNG